IPWAWRLPSRGTLTPLRERSSLPLPVLARKGQESPLEGTLRCPIASGLSAVTSARVSLVAIPAEHRRAPPPTPAPTPFPQERGGDFTPPNPARSCRTGRRAWSRSPAESRARAADA